MKKLIIVIFLLVAGVVGGLGVGYLQQPKANKASLEVWTERDVYNTGEQIEVFLLNSSPKDFKQNMFLRECEVEADLLIRDSDNNTFKPRQIGPCIILGFFGNVKFTIPAGEKRLIATIYPENVYGSDGRYYEDKTSLHPGIYELEVFLADSRQPESYSRKIELVEK